MIVRAFAGARVIVRACACACMCLCVHVRACACAGVCGGVVLVGVWCWVHAVMWVAGACACVRARARALLCHAVLCYELVPCNNNWGGLSPKPPGQQSKSV